MDYNQNNTLLSKSLTETLKSLDGTVVVLESLKNRRGVFIDAYRSNQGALITGCPQSELVGTEWCKFILHYIENDVVCFESVRYRDHYLDCCPDKLLDRHIIRVTPWNYTPQEEGWARFRIFGEKFSNIAIRSERWIDRWLDNYDGLDRESQAGRELGNSVGALLGTQSDPDRIPEGSWSRFALRFSEQAIESFALTATFWNRTEIPVDYTFRYKLGISNTREVAVENSISVSMEVETGFSVPAVGDGSVKLGTTFSHAWSNSDSTTFDSESESLMTVTVGPGRVAKFYQLRAKYGPLSIGSHHIITEQEYADNMNYLER